MKFLSNFKWMIFCFGLVMLSSLRSQTPEIPFEKREEVPDFHFDIMTVASQDSGLTTFRFYTKIAYDELQFIKKEDRFYAQYELSVTVFDQNGYQAEGKIVRQEIWVDFFEETNSRVMFDICSIEFNLKPAVYELLVGVMDFDSRKTGRLKTRLNVPQYFQNSLELSKVILADRVETDSSGALTVIPNIMGNYGDQQLSLYLWFEVYNLIELDSLKVNYRIVNLKDEEIRSFSEYYQLTGERTEIVIPVAREDLNAGKYQLEVYVGKGKAAVKQILPLSVQWLGMPAYANDLEKAIDQLKYIAEGKEMKEMKKAEEDEKTRLFREFWKSKDPTPNTEQNEVMEEYYRRVDYANATFGTFIDGWRTDRGMVYIVLGGPNDIDRHPFEVDSKPYEIWSYYQYNRQFIFIDESGFGEYRLVSPFWEILNEIR